MPDRGLLERNSIHPGNLGGATPAPWTLPGARWAQLTYEVAKQAALESLPGDVGRPVPCYARLLLLDAPQSPAGPFRLAALMVGGRYRLMPRNVLVEGVVDGPLEAFSGAFGSPFRAGPVSLERAGAVVEGGVAVGGDLLAELRLPALYAIEPGMLRWDAWLGYAAGDGVVQLIEYGPRPEPEEAFLSKNATLVTPAALPRSHLWRRFRNLNTISACYLEGDLTLTAPEVQQVIL
ncbi:MAG: hypothetical protein ACR2HN_10365 [Tepidiformaceae bacterium]